MAAIWASCEYTKRGMRDSVGTGLHGAAARGIAIRALCILLIRYARFGEGTKYDAGNFT